MIANWAYGVTSTRVVIYPREHDGRHLFCRGRDE